MNFDMYQEKRTHETTKRIFTSKVQYVLVDSVTIMVQMTSEGFDTVFKSLVIGDKEVVQPFEAPKWLKENLLGEITKGKLDQ